jgi:hypothetical protein
MEEHEYWRTVLREKQVGRLKEELKGLVSGETPWK